MQTIQLQIPQERERNYNFDAVFGDASTQEEIFEQTCLPLVYSVLNGYNATYFVYGQTGTGKTHTMGVLHDITPNSRGIIP